jgi:hypothetical protein
MRVDDASLADGDRRTARITDGNNLRAAGRSNLLRTKIQSDE